MVQPTNNDRVPVSALAPGDLQVTAIEITLPAGVQQVQAVIHASMPGLGVTMALFGVFEVTHLQSGLRIGGRYERMGSALLVAAQLATIAANNGFSWAELDAESAYARVAEIGQQPVPFSGYTSTSVGVTRPLSVAQWLASITSATLDWIGEFPWEAEHPADVALALLGSLSSSTSQSACAVE